MRLSCVAFTVLRQQAAEFGRGGDKPVWRVSHRHAAQHSAIALEYIVVQDVGIQRKPVEAAEYGLRFVYGNGSASG